MADVADIAATTAVACVGTPSVAVVFCFFSCEFSRTASGNDKTATLSEAITASHQC